MILGDDMEILIESSIFMKRSFYRMMWAVNYLPSHISKLTHIGFRGDLDWTPPCIGQQRF
jgi:hypothetical protein